MSGEAAVVFAEVRDDSGADAEQLPRAANAAAAPDDDGQAAAAVRWKYEVQAGTVEVPPVPRLRPLDPFECVP